MTAELGFIGAGNMAEAIATAAIRQQVLKPDQMIASDPSEARRAVFAQLGISTAESNTEVIRSSKRVMIAVKPQGMEPVAKDLASSGQEDQVILSIMAGVTSKKLGNTITGAATRPAKPRVIRIMPNTPLQAGYGMSGIALGAHAQPGDEEFAVRLFSAAGRVVVVEESQIDAITAVSGSGPAYLFYFAEAMEKAATNIGLTPDDARLLVRQTILGAAHLLNTPVDNPLPPDELRRRVTSPGGTTEAAIREMETRGLTAIVEAAIEAAQKRSIELGS